MFIKNQIAYKFLLGAWQKKRDEDPIEFVMSHIHTRISGVTMWVSLWFSLMTEIFRVTVTKKKRGWVEIKIVDGATIFSNSLEG